MEPKLASLLEELAQRGYATESWTYAATPSPTLKLPAQSPAVGSLVVYDEGHELTVEVGTKYHTHFDSADVTDLVEQAADFIEEVLADQIGMTLFYDDQRCLGVSLFFPGREELDAESQRERSVSHLTATYFPTATRVESFVWSGPCESPL